MVGGLFLFTPKEGSGPKQPPSWQFHLLSSSAVHVLRIHKGVKEEYWIEAEEWLCNFIAEYGQRIFETASSLEIVPQKVEEIVMNL